MCSEVYQCVATMYCGVSEVYSLYTVLHYYPVCTHVAAVYWCVLQCIADGLRCIRLIPSPGPPGRAAGLLAAIDAGGVYQCVLPVY